ncbi:MAG TPA: DEAD/DEAH box helicase, partial [Tepidisphaeraceae bacterium]|nr:DEAD/DEAH box helicase [Tepidisphaeraceae bacterium]
GNRTAAWLVRAHHAPGLPSLHAHFDADGIGFKLRGRRRDSDDRHRHEAQIRRTDSRLAGYLADHAAVCGSDRTPVAEPKKAHGLAMRLALSCVVDADHTDTATFDSGRKPPRPLALRAAERLEALRRYVGGLPAGETKAERERNRRRSDFFAACLESTMTGPMVACEGPVGLGKTTAVAAYLLRRAAEHTPNLRRLIVVAPYTNILSQTADRLRKALVLPGESPDRVIVEHHHRADFADRDNRELAALWQAPVVLTTAVSFFETLAACGPAALRKLHALPGSAVFLDEAHAALPTRLWPQNWRWIRELAERWSCRFVFASGSLARFWEDEDIVREPMTLPELLPKVQAADVLNAEKERVKYRQLRDGAVVKVKDLVKEVRGVAGPRLVILNTVQNAAVVAKAMRKAGMRVMHLSTALCPGDRECILARVMRWLEAGWKNWTLVATSVVEAGVDISFRCAFRERFAVASTIQVGGRVNRNGEYSAAGGGTVYDFALADDLITQHPAAKVSADVLRGLLAADELNGGNPADVVTNAMVEELRRLPLADHELLINAERNRDYPLVAELGRVITADTRVVVVDPRLKKRLARGLPVTFRALLRGSVQLWADKIDKLGIQPLPGREELFVWKDAYDPDFLGIMAGVLRTDDFLAEGGGVI